MYTKTRFHSVMFVSKKFSSVFLPILLLLVFDNVLALLLLLPLIVLLLLHSLLLLDDLHHHDVIWCSSVFGLCIINKTTDSQEIVWIVLCFGKQIQFEVLNSKEIICIKADRHHCIVNSSTMMLKGLTALILISSLCAKHYLVKTKDKSKSKFFKGFYSNIFWKI